MVLRAIGWTLTSVALVFVLAAWRVAWSDHQREVERIRFVWGPDAEVPAFTPLTLINPAKLSLETWSWYILAFAAGVPGLLFLIFSRHRKRSRHRNS